MTETHFKECIAITSSLFIKRRKELGITQEELADLSGLGIVTIKRFETNTQNITYSNLLILCHHLELYPAFLNREPLDTLTEAMNKGR